MAVKENKNELFYSKSLIDIIIKYKKHLLIISVLTIIISIIFSGPTFITPLYKSEVVLYPTASNSISKAILSNKGTGKDILEFGKDEQAEQLLQILKSNKIRDRIIQKYNLMQHYGIKPDEKYRMTKLYKTYDDNFKFKRTQYMAVNITVFDKDPQMAADMANDVAHLLDSTINNMQKKIAKKAFEIVAAEYKKKQEEIRKEEDSLKVLREYGVHDYESQAEMFNRQLAIEMAKGNKEGVKRLQKKLDVLAKYGGAYVSIRNSLEYDKKQLSDLKEKYDEAKVDAESTLPHTFIVSNAYKAEKKSYPIRWLIVVISVLSTFFLSVIIFGVIEYIKQTNIKKR